MNNVILIGMPASGKSTVGALLAKELDRVLLDTDAEIVRRTGINIPTLIRERGEAAFREIEAETVRSLAGGTAGAVIATGGGAILRNDSLRALHRTGRLYFLDRPLDALVTTADRPLSSTKEAIAQRHRERYPIYVATADAIIANSATPEAAVQQVKKEFFK